MNHPIRKSRGFIYISSYTYRNVEVNRFAQLACMVGIHFVKLLPHRHAAIDRRYKHKVLNTPVHMPYSISYYKR